MKPSKLAIAQDSSKKTSRVHAPMRRRCKISKHWPGFPIIAICGLATNAAVATPLAIPDVAAKHGYDTLTWDTEFSEETVDITDRHDAFFSWYPYRLFGSFPDKQGLRLNDDKSITMIGGEKSLNAQVITVSPTSNPPFFRGTAFGGGGYFTASVRVSPLDMVPNRIRGWPSFWALAVEGVFAAGGRAHDSWPGQVEGYRHNIEVDVFEFLDRIVSRQNPSVRYGAALHDWYGLYAKKCPQLCQVQTPINMSAVPKDTDWKEYHEYGFLWVCATEKSKGFAEFYFDGELMGRSAEWALWDGEQRVPPPKGDWIYSWLDKQHLVLIIGSGQSQPISVRWVRVRSETTLTTSLVVEFHVSCGEVAQSANVPTVNEVRTRCAGAKSNPCRPDSEQGHR